MARLDLETGDAPLTARQGPPSALDPLDPGTGRRSAADEFLMRDYSVPLQRLETLSQQRRGDARRSWPGLVEGPAAVQQVADDDRRPALRQQLRAPVGQN